MSGYRSRYSEMDEQDMLGTRRRSAWIDNIDVPVDEDRRSVAPSERRLPPPGYAAARRDDQPATYPSRTSILASQPARSIRGPTPAPTVAAKSESSHPYTEEHPEAATALEKLSLTSFHVRPGYGTQGKPITVLSNFFAVRCRNNERGKIIHHYDVEIDPIVKVEGQKKPKRLLREVWEQLSSDQQLDPKWKDAFASCAYDGRKNAFTPVKFPFPEGHVQYFYAVRAPDGVVRQSKGEDSSSDEEARKWRIAVKRVAEIDLELVMQFCKADQHTPSREEECLTAVMATNVLMRDLPSRRFAQVGATGNKFFTMDQAKPIPQGGMICRGFTQSFRYSNAGTPLLNLDIVHSAFLATGPAVEVVAKIIGRDRATGMRGRGGYLGGVPRAAELSELSPQEIGMVKNKLRGVKFQVTHRQSARLHTVVSITAEPAESLRFSLHGKDGSERRLAITEYFKDYYGVRVTKPRLPCVQYGKKAFIPLEFVNFVEWNPLPPPKLSVDQTVEMIRHSALRPSARVDAVMGWRKELAYEKQDKLARWGLEVRRTMIEIKARVLSPPQVLYQNNMHEWPSDGGWKMRDHKFFRNGLRPLTCWAVISFDYYCDTDTMKRYWNFLVDRLRKHGVVVNNARPSLIGPVDPRQRANVVNALQKAARDSWLAGREAQLPEADRTPQMICCILPGRDAWLYESIKKIAFTELKGPVPTQCLQAAKIRAPKGVEAYTDNLILKIQSKLGGLTHQVPLSELPGMVRGKTMLLGAGLGHPPIKSGYVDAPTVACTVATYTPECDQYSAQVRLQPGREEIVRDLAGMIEAHLKLFFTKNNGTYPERIIIFRDGISEGQYAAALVHEHSEVLRACTRLRRGYRPKILICVCAKRHNTRFFAREEADADRSGNLHPGLVVDRGVAHPFVYDFFIQAHAGRVGTARPTHYICLLDEISLSPDDLQKLVHGLCYSFARCTRSVSLVPVCYIADLVCSKARIMLSNSGTSSYAPSETGSAGTGVRSRFTGQEIDHMQLQKILERNPELADVMWWM